MGNSENPNAPKDALSWGYARGDEVHVFIQSVDPGVFTGTLIAWDTIGVMIDVSGYDTATDGRTTFRLFLPWGEVQYIAPARVRLK